MTKLVRITATGAAALLMTVAGVLGAGAATADDGNEWSIGTDGTRVTSVDTWEWSIWEWSIGTDGTRVTSDDAWDW